MGWMSSKGVTGDVLTEAQLQVKLDEAPKNLLQRWMNKASRMVNLTAGSRALSGEFDLAQQLDIGAREYQEDAVIVDDASDAKFRVCVLADGMGGHAAGDVASKIVSETVFETLKKSLVRAKTTDEKCFALTHASDSANEKLQDYAEANPKALGMGSTLVAAAFFEDHLHWISIGDSPFYLYRDGKLTQINEDHSLARQIDQMAMFGLLSKDEARRHPDRNCLTSALRGTPPELVDIRSEPFALCPDDIFVLSSDGLQFLQDDEIEGILRKEKKGTAMEISAVLMNSVLRNDDPIQDNISIAVVKVGGK